MKRFIRIALLLLTVITLSFFALTSCKAETPDTDVETEETEKKEETTENEENKEEAPEEENKEENKEENTEKEDNEENTEEKGDTEDEKEPEIVYYTVKFVTETETNIADLKVEAGKTATAPATPEKIGYIFDGWYVENNKWDFTTAVTKDMTLTAKWTECTTHTPDTNGNCTVCKNDVYYTVTFVTAKGDAVPAQTVKHGAKVTAPSAIRVGCEVVSAWNAADTAWNFATDIVTSDVTLTASWKLECIFGEWTTTKEATCTEAGEETRTCSTGEHTETREIAGGHIYSEVYNSNASLHWRECIREGCGKKSSAAAHKSDAPATAESAEYCKTCGYMMNDKLHMLSNKKVIFIGNSHTYFGGVVQEKTQDVFEQSQRVNDKGYFYQLATANGAVNLSVTNWTFGGHSLKDIFSGDCQANRVCGNGSDHAKYLVDTNYDYVVIQQGSTDGSTVEYWLDHVMNIFKASNPNVKFIFLVQARAHNDNYSWLTKVKDFEKKGLTVVDWGDLVYDVYTGATKVPGATLEYNKNSFVIAKTSTDGYHPNLLAGYIVSLFTYCAITGEEAEGQPYNFYSTTYNVNSFYNNNYKVGTSNFREIFKSAADMKGLQQLVDQYFEAKYYQNDYQAKTLDEVKAAGKLTVATSPDYPPFQNIDGEEVVGIEIDIIKLICEELGVELEIKTMDYNSVISGIANADFDCAVSGITITDEQLQKMLFTSPYYALTQCIVVKEGSTIASKADLEGKKIAVQTGTTAEECCIAKNYGVMSHAANVDAKAALAAGMVDAWVVDNLTAYEMIEDSDGLVILSETMLEEPYAFACAFGSGTLLDAIDTILQRLVADGTVAEIFEKYGMHYTAPTK